MRRNRENKTGQLAGVCTSRTSQCELPLSTSPKEKFESLVLTGAEDFKNTYRGRLKSAVHTYMANREQRERRAQWWRR